MKKVLIVVDRHDIDPLISRYQVHRPVQYRDGVNESFPSSIRGFDSLRPLQFIFAVILPHFVVNKKRLRNAILL
ncbi:TPA: hypothetical protein HMS98_24115 [Escherichia coli]|nr:hypothetical protein [Escherichia coli]HAJ2744121.1 hypothetical protein [Escherichia coli]